MCRFGNGKTRQVSFLFHFLAAQLAKEGKQRHAKHSRIDGIQAVVEADGSRRCRRRRRATAETGNGRFQSLRRNCSHRQRYAFLFSLSYKKQNGGQLAIRWGSNRYSIFNLISLSLSCRQGQVLSTRFLCHRVHSVSRRMDVNKSPFKHIPGILANHPLARSHTFCPLFSLSLSFLNDYIYIVIILGKIGRTKKAFRVNFYQTGKWGMFRGWSEYVAIFS